MATFATAMNRRHFCKIASIAAGAIGLGTIPASALTIANTGIRSGKSIRRMPHDCRVSVLRRECHLDLQAIYLDDPDTGPCDLFKSGDRFSFAAGAECPERFCPRLWELICSSSNHGDCSLPQAPSTTVVACPDGTRPVIVKIELTA